MPLVRISFKTGRAAGFGRAVGDQVFLAMRETINVPAGDHFQILTAHDLESFVYDPSFLGISRTDGIVIIQITLNEGRTVEMKKNLYAAIADRLNRELGVRREDVLISLIEVKKENWSFGNGEAPFAGA